jgi:hypothetical protein
MPILKLAPSEQETAAKVLAKLFVAAGQPNVKQPTVKITSENKKVAAYYPKNNSIFLDQKAWDICRSMGKVSLDALAFILGHELAHAFQKEVRLQKQTTNFLSYDKAYAQAIRTEKVADIQGVFTAFLAGYRPGEVVPVLLRRLYEAYLLTGRQLTGYPTLEERSRSADEVLDIVGVLVDLYETTNYLIVAKQYELASVNYEYIRQYYQGREISNNLGVLYLLTAMEYYLPATDRYVYPVEIDNTTPLKKLEKARGGYDLSPTERLLRNRLIEKAIASFREALLLDKNYRAAQLNLICALNLVEKPQEALDFAQKHKLKPGSFKKTRFASDLYLALGISYALKQDAITANSYFSNAMNAGQPASQLQAKFNLDVLANKEVIFFPGQTVELPEEFTQLIKSIGLGRISQAEPLLLGENGYLLRRQKDGKTATFSFGNQNGSIASLVRFINDLSAKTVLPALSEPLERSFFYNLVATSHGYYLLSGNDVVLKLSPQGAVEEIVRVYQ